MQQDALIMLGAAWLLMTVVSYMLFHRGTDADKKRKLWPYFTTGSNVAIASVIAYMQPPIVYMVGIVLFMVPLTVLTIRSTKFCPSCASPNRSPFFTAPPKKCNVCQTALK
ncbi:membrane protein [Photobacterium aquae]|uniref:Membrane protein n=1 Tax=Photobacterium aquae TaxID=1195763 RepID=A0A0J1H5F3_9GAMM|nr:membrane protein [Photobacterium aquae]